MSLRFYSLYRAIASLSCFLSFLFFSFVHGSNVLYIMLLANQFPDSPHRPIEVNVLDTIVFV